MMHKLAAAITLTALAISASPNQAVAYPIEDLSVLEKVYLEGLFSNETVLIIDIDRAGNRVKVQRKDGFSEWVNPSRIMSKWEARADALGKGVGVALIAQCSFMEDNCDSARLGQMIHDGEYRLGDPFPKKGGGFLPAKSSTGSRNPGGVPDFMNPEAFNKIPTADDLPPAAATAPATVTAPAAGTQTASKVRLFIQNDCHEKIGVHYALKTSEFDRASPFVLELLPGERKAIKIGNRAEFEHDAEVHFTASSLSFTWKAKQDVTINGAVRPYLKGKLSNLPNNGRKLGLTCTN